MADKGECDVAAASVEPIDVDDVDADENLGFLCGGW